MKGDFVGLSLVLQGVATIISAIGVILIALMRKKVDQVEKQGNSVSLELKRTNMVFAERLAVSTRQEGDRKIADEAKIAYDEAVKQNAKL